MTEEYPVKQEVVVSQIENRGSNGKRKVKVRQVLKRKVFLGFCNCYFCESKVGVLVCENRSHQIAGKEGDRRVWFALETLLWDLVHVQRYDHLWLF